MTEQARLVSQRAVPGRGLPESENAAPGAGRDGDWSMSGYANKRDLHGSGRAADRPGAAMSSGVTPVLENEGDE